MAHKHQSTSINTQAKNNFITYFFLYHSQGVWQVTQFFYYIVQYINGSSNTWYYKYIPANSYVFKVVFGCSLLPNKHLHDTCVHLLDLIVKHGQSTNTILWIYLSI